MERSIESTEHSMCFRLINTDSIERIMIFPNKTIFPKPSQRSNWLHSDSANRSNSFSTLVYVVYRSITMQSCSQPDTRKCVQTVNEERKAAARQL